MNSMNVKQIDQEVRYQEWAAIIKECRSSGMHVKEWCEMKGIKPASYYYYLRAIRLKTIEQSKENVSFVPVPVNNQDSLASSVSITIHKNDTEIILNNADFHLIQNVLELLK